MSRPLHRFAKRARGARAGFTLVELLAVMAIIAILSVASVTTFFSINSALNLSTGAQIVTSELSLARQRALTLDGSVQLRFYKYADSTGASAASEFQAMQVFSATNGTTAGTSTYTPLEKIKFLPSNIMLASDPTYSSGLGGTGSGAPPLMSAAAGDPPILLNNVGTSYQYVAVQFKADGTMDLSQPGNTNTTLPASWFVTVYEKKFAATEKPSNFITINMDPIDGQIGLFQP